MKLVKNLKAISPLVATIILITITIAGGLLVYALFSTTSSTASSTAKVSIDAKLVKVGDDVSLSINVKNVGNKPIDNLNYTLSGASDGDESKQTMAGAANLEPGHSASENFDCQKTGYVVGESYMLLVEVEYSDKSTSADVLSVMCTSG